MSRETYWIQSKEAVRKYQPPANYAVAAISSKRKRHSIIVYYGVRLEYKPPNGEPIPATKRPQMWAYLASIECRNNCNLLRVQSEEAVRKYQPPANYVVAAISSKRKRHSIIVYYGVRLDSKQIAVITTLDARQARPHLRPLRCSNGLAIRRLILKPHAIIHNNAVPFPL